LHYAAEFPTKQSGAIVELMLQYGSLYDKKALETACSKGNVAAAEKLIDKVLGLDISHHVAMLRFIGTAVRNREGTVVQTFIKAGGFDGNSNPLLGQGQLYELNQKELQDYIRFLYDCGMDINAVDAEGCTPLMHAVRSRREPLAKMLLSYEDIALHLQDQNGDTALHLAMNNLSNSPHIFSDERVHRLFIQQHTSEHFEIPNSLGLTPLSLALLCEDVQKVFTTEELLAILAPGCTLDKAVDSLSNYQFGQWPSVRDGIDRVVRNLQFFSSLVPITAPHMGFMIDAYDARKEFEVIERTIRGLRVHPITLPMCGTRSCRLHSTPKSFHCNAGVLYKDVEATICLVIARQK
jgi:ankyrin repeat protein